MKKKKLKEEKDENEIIHIREKDENIQSSNGEKGKKRRKSYKEEGDKRHYFKEDNVVSDRSLKIKLV